MNPYPPAVTTRGVKPGDVIEVELAPGYTRLFAITDFEAHTDIGTQYRMVLKGDSIPTLTPTPTAAPKATALGEIEKRQQWRSIDDE
jgi:hypothetical protein